MTKSRRRVAHVTTAHPHTDNRILRKECAALAMAGLDVWLVAVAPRDEQHNGVSIAALPRRCGRVRRLMLGSVDAWRALGRLNPDMIHVHDPELIPLAILWRHVRQRPAVYDAHEDLAKQILGKPYIPAVARPIAAAFAGLLRRAADNFLDGVVAATPAISRIFVRAPVTLVQNFPWLSTFPPPSPMTERTLSATYVGAVTEARGLTEMVRAASDTGCELILAGHVSSPEDANRLATAGPNVHSLGVIDPDAIPALLASARLGLALLHPLPNYLESQSTKIYEYMAAGRPFVASDFPSWRQQLEHFDCGIFVDPLDQDAIDRAVNVLLTDVQRARQMGARGRRALEDHFVFEREAQLLIEMTKSLLDWSGNSPTHRETGTHHRVLPHASPE